MLFQIGIAQARASLEITWQIMHIHQKYHFDSSQSQGFVVLHGTPVGVLFDSWLVYSLKNSSEALFFSQVEFSTANGKLANRQGQPCYRSYSVKIGTH